MSLPPASTPLVSESGSPTTALSVLTGQLALSLLLGAVATVAVAIASGLLAATTNQVFLYAAVIAGIIVGGAMLWPMGNANPVVRIGILVVAAVLTIVAVLAGDFLYYTLRTVDRNSVGLLDAVKIAAPRFIEAEMKDGGLSVVFGLLGTASTFFKRGRG